MADQQKPQEDCVFDFTPEYLATLKADDGSPTSRIPVGDYRFRVTATSKKATKKQDHVMMMVDLVVVSALDQAHNDAVGMTATNIYAGSRESPKKMQARLKAFTDAVNLQLPAGQLMKHTDLVGREFDATVVWELSDGSPDPTTGMIKKFVNDRVRYERKAGQARSQHANPDLDSRAAVNYLREQGQLSDDDGSGAGMPADGGASVSTPPWGGGQAAAPVTPPPVAEPTAAPPATAGPAAASAPVTAPGFKPESEEPDDVHAYRASVVIGGANAAEVRQALINYGFNPDGPIDANRINDAKLKAEYLAKIAPAAAAAGPGGLPPLPGLGGKGKRGGKGATA